MGAGHAGQRIDDHPLQTPTKSSVSTRWCRGWISLTRSGLETYISGGMSPPRIAQATRAGVDGIGIGLWIHKPGNAPGNVGELDADHIREAIRVRNKAEVRRRYS